MQDSAWYMRRVEHMVKINTFYDSVERNGKLVFWKKISESGPIQLSVLDPRIPERIGRILDRIAGLFNLAASIGLASALGQTCARCAPGMLGCAVSW